MKYILIKMKTKEFTDLVDKNPTLFEQLSLMEREVYEKVLDKIRDVDAGRD